MTLPRTPMPTAGYPLAVFVRAGGGGDRPLVDRGARAKLGDNPVETGEGPARYFARAGFAGMQFDGPHGGLRHQGDDEQFDMFNVTNLGALRDNVRQSALELVLAAHLATDLELDASDCPPTETSTKTSEETSEPGPSNVRFDVDHFALMGHSTGATIAPLAFAQALQYGALLLSGAGGSWIENIVHKRKPIPLAGAIELFLRLDTDLHTHDPVLSLAQWALESADPPVYGRGAVGRHILMMQGVVDNYILPQIANAASLSLKLDLAGSVLDDTSVSQLGGQTSLASLLPLVGRRVVSLPAAGNVDKDVTAVVLQYPEDGIEDGHEVVFQTDAPKHHYSQFLTTWIAGVPTVPNSR